MNELYYKIAERLVGNYDLADVWVGLVTACMGGLIMLRVYYGKSYAHLIKLHDIGYWLVGVFVFMRFGMLTVRLTGLEKIVNNDSLDASVMGFLGGILNVYLFKNNYKPILKFTEKWLKNENQIQKVLTAKERLKEIISQIETHFDFKTFVYIKEITNGGAAPKTDKPLYFSVIESNNQDLMNIWGCKKSLCSNGFVKKMIEMFTNGFAKMDVANVDVSGYEAWCSVNNVTTKSYFLIGTEGRKRALMLVIASGVELSEKDNLKMMSYAKKIKRILNESRHIFETKIN